MQNSIVCPNCKIVIDVQSVVYEQINKAYLKEQSQKEQAFNAQMQEREAKLSQALQALKHKEESLEQRIQKDVEKHLKTERQKLQESLKQSLQAEQQEAMDALQKELNEKSSQVKELHLTKAALEQSKREKEELETQIAAKYQAQFNAQMQSFKEKAQNALEAQHLLKLKEKDKQLEDLRKQLQDAERKAALGSQQLQGEVQELAIEEYLRANFPFDNVSEIKKGQNGADCLQIVHTREMQNCGILYYESKRTKNFQKEWIEKLKSDMRQKGADIGVLVTETLPKELELMGVIDGVFVCRFEEFKALSFVLRDCVLRVHLARKSEENKQDKMQMLYTYLTSTEFRMQIEAIVEGFTQMQQDLEQEKRAMQRIWKQREKQIQKVLDNSIHMYGALKGIAGDAIANVKALELPFMED